MAFNIIFLIPQGVITSLELKVANLEEQLEAESRERLAQQKSSRKLDKKMKELALQLDEERRHADQYKEQIEKVSRIIVLLECCYEISRPGRKGQLKECQ